MHVAASLFVALLAGALSACATSPVAPVEPGQVMRKLGFLRNGETTRREVLDRMGTTLASYEKDAMLTYLLYGDELGGFSVGAPPARGTLRGEYSLVLVFDAQDVLRKHSLVFKK